jgi:hypothetical protein
MAPIGAHRWIGFTNALFKTESLMAINVPIGDDRYAADFSIMIVEGPVDGFATPERPRTRAFHRDVGDSST